MSYSMPGLPVHHQIPEFSQTHVHESVMPSNHLILCHPLLLLPSMFPSIRVFANESAVCIRWPKYWSFSFSIRPSNEYSRLIFFRMDWLDLLAVQRTLKSLLQFHSSKASILQCSAFFIVQLSHPYMLLLLSRFSPVQLCSPPGSSVHGILQTRILEQVAIFFSTSIHDYWKNHSFY